MSQYAATARTLSRAPLAGKAFAPALPTLGRAAPPYQSKWKRDAPVPLSGENFLDVLFNRTPVIKQPGFLDLEACFAHEKALSHRIAPYRYYTGPLLQRVGCAQFEYQAQAAADFENRKNEKEEYFKVAQSLSGLHQEVADQTGVNAWEKVIGTLRALLPEYEIVRASEGPGKTYFSGNFRALNDSTCLHCDWTPYDAATEDWIINRVTHQAVFNLYMAPVKGGRTWVHDVEWSEECLNFRDPDTYGYRDEIIHGRQNVVVKPEVGDLWFFNSRNMHQVEKVEPEPCPELGLPYRPRLCLSSFIGLLPEHKAGGRPRLILWS
ncbi:hypothetical protein FANTH_2594 [Fusarium anthophilum]|uniref:Uncharacterized protein n=1 Tax=Fusarium anthophilum TaxID=48485 RepID=A0A8H4ZTD1_9HYPO|nr:hypothetical protein FANTH_2594 [Fusarium anthophilum]